MTTNPANFPEWYRPSSHAPPAPQTRKRRELSPPAHPDPANSSTLFSATTSHPEKRRRVNLANGFSTLSIGQPSVVSDQQDSVDDDEGLGPSVYPRDGRDDVKVEYLSEDPYPTGVPHHHSSRPWPVPSYPQTAPSTSSSVSPPTSGDEKYDSSAVYPGKFPRLRRFAGIAQQADEVVQPGGEALGADSTLSDLGVEDVTGASPLPRARRRREECFEEKLGPAEKRPRTDRADIDMNSAQGSDNYEGRIPKERDKRRGRKTVWYEPEKDRIVISSLSDSESHSSRSPSPESDNRSLSQPGEHGFTISPSLLTRLIESNAKDVFDLNPALRELFRNNRRSLTLFRPALAPPPCAFKGPVVRTWSEEDSGRFEEIDDDESYNEGPFPNDDIDTGMEVEVTAGPEWNCIPWVSDVGETRDDTLPGDVDVDMAMDVEE